MWTLDSRWFDVAGLTTLLVVLTAVFNRFERHKPAWRRISKIVVLAALILVLTETAGRAWAYGALVVMLAAGTAFHFAVLSRLGINGWTGEPRDRFEALLRDIEAKGELPALLSVLRPRRRSSP